MGRHIELPPRPVEGDLPSGDLPAWIPHADEDSPGPVGEPIPPEQWMADELLRMVALEIEHRERHDVLRGLLADVLEESQRGWTLSRGCEEPNPFVGPGPTPHGGSTARPRHPR